MTSRIIKNIFAFLLLIVGFSILLPMAYMSFYILIYVFIIHQIVREQENPIFFGFDLSQTSALPVIGKINGIVESSYVWMIEKFQDSYLGDYYLEIIFLFPLALLTLEAITDIQFRKSKKDLLGAWIGFIIIYGGCYLFISEKNLFSFVILTVPSLCIYVLLDHKRSHEEGYSSAKRVRGFRLLSRSTFDEAYSRLYLRTSMFFLCILLFWFHIPLSSASVAQIYYAFISSSLVVLGFVALTFTYAHEKMGSPKVLENIETDTNLIYRVVGLVIISSLTGLILFNSQQIQFVLPAGFDTQVLATSIFLVSCTGTILSIEKTIITFSSIATNLPHPEQTKDKFKILFDERRQQPSFSVMTTTESGWSDLQHHLFDRGHEVIPFEGADSWAFRKYQKVAIVIQACSSEINKDHAEIYRGIVETGSVLIVFTDSGELNSKSLIFETFGLDKDSILALKKEQLENEYFLNVSLPGDQNHTWDKSQLTVSPGGALVFEDEADLDPVINVNIKGDEFIPELHPATYIGSKPVGKGLLIVVGAITPWSNHSIHNRNAIECLDAILDRASTVLN